MKRQDEGLAFLLRYENVAWYEDGKVRILDRRIYPNEIKFVTCNTYGEVAQAITDMVTQSAGPYTAAGMGMALAAYESRDMAEDDMLAFLEKAARTISSARPTTTARMTIVTNDCLNTARKAIAAAEKVDEAIFERTIYTLNKRYAAMETVGEYLVDLFPDNGNIMTQCYAETIVGTMLRVAKRRGKNLKLFVPETRPYFQGARLTASVALEQGFDTTLITDNMPAFTMVTKKIDVFTSAADAIVLDGHIVNKVGTYQIAIAAKYHGIPYFVSGMPDKGHPTIDTVEIEERDPKLVLEARGVKNTLEGVKGYYPSFDITPPHLVSGVVTDKGIYSAYDLHRYFEDEAKHEFLL
ncbi:MAG: S-methyl-5-thioribose-1-phosphate isomerase [Eubacteriales bacterium]|nr:S-methyl-5-thioribose-1-phosphate isomerase [Eubacteriales bacterium]MDD4541669.1 S-methyl-5-thioribose-1-phosphate isomerase [Eubacteriales bacterium]